MKMALGYVTLKEVPPPPQLSMYSGPNLSAFAYWPTTTTDALRPLSPKTSPEASPTSPPPTSSSTAAHSTHNTHRNDALKTNSINTKARPHCCPECGKSFLLKHHLTTHSLTHSGLRPHVCGHCGKTFTHKHCLNTHLLLHSGRRPHQCHECKKSFTLKHHLLTHSKVHSRAKPFVCTECGRAFPVKRHLTTHAKFHAGQRPFVCDECGDSFSQKDHLVMHSRFHGSTNSFVCRDCGATFMRKFELANHGRLHGREPHSCPVCHKEFLQKRTLVAHMTYHTTQHACANCNPTNNSTNTTTKNLINHNHHHHHHHHHRKLSCSDCGCIFYTTEALALHVKLHTGDELLLDDLQHVLATTFEPVTSCTISGNSGIVTPAIGLKHNVHTTTSRSYVCVHCARAYTSKHGLQQHMKRHPDGACVIRSHICPVCSKGFFQRNHLLLHQRQHMETTSTSTTDRKSVVTESATAAATLLLKPEVFDNDTTPSVL